VLGGQCVQLGDFRQGSPPVSQLVELGIQRLEVK
jgi:hypothetical protein